MTERTDIHCTVAHALKIMPWGYGQSPLSALFQHIGAAIERPIVPKVQGLQDVLNDELLEVRKRLLESFADRFPMYSLESLWASIQLTKKEIPEIRAMQTDCLAVFVNTTFWCFAKEGTRQTGRFSIDRVWRAAGVAREVIAGYVEPVSFTTECGSCNHVALGTSLSASVKSASRPTTIQCSHCGHIDRVGRKTDFRDKGDFEPRIACPCPGCEMVRASAISYAQAQIESTIQETAKSIANQTGAQLNQLGKLKKRQRSWMFSRVDLDKKVEFLLAGGSSLDEALFLVGSKEMPGLKDRAEVVAEMLSEGISVGWLALGRVRTLGAGDELLSASMQSIEHWLSEYGSYSLDELRADVGSGKIDRLCRAIKECADKYPSLVAPVEVECAWIDSERRAIDATDDGFQAIEPHLQALGVVGGGSHDMARQPEYVHQSPHGNSAAAAPLAVTAALALMQRCIREIDHSLGAGTASRCPQLVAELMASVRFEEGP